MGRLVYSFSVEEGSIAHRRIETWKAGGENFSAFIVDLIEDHRAAHIKALQKKLKWIRWELEQRRDWRGNIKCQIFDVEDWFGESSDEEYHPRDLPENQQKLDVTPEIEDESIDSKPKSAMEQWAELQKELYE